MIALTILSLKWWHGLVVFESAFKPEDHGFEPRKVLVVRHFTTSFEMSSNFEREIKAGAS